MWRRLICAIAGHRSEGWPIWGWDDAVASYTCDRCGTEALVAVRLDPLGEYFAEKPARWH